MEVDTVAFGQQGAKLGTQTTTNLSFRGYENIKNFNNKLPAYVDANIKATHFEIGPGGAIGPTENKEKYSPRSGKESRTYLSPERIAFMKNSHFKIGT